MKRWNKIFLMSFLVGIFLLNAAFAGAVEKTQEQAPPPPPEKQIKQSETPPPATPQAAQKQPPYAEPYPMGFISIELTKVAAGVGLQWGKGVLTYKGKEYTFKVKGIQIASVGINKVTTKGNVYNLFSIAEFPGQYVAAGAGATIIKGKEVQDFKNTKGVHIVFTGTPTGLNLSFGPEGFTIRMEEAEGPVK